MRPGEPVEFSEQTPVDLPVAAFPPFKLRSSMVDTDPVIWVHLIEVFIHYVQTVLSLTVPQTERSEQQLCIFVKSYLHEIAEEQGQLLSLGLINVQITENLETLRAWMFELIKQLGCIRLKLNGESLWDFAKIYALKNAETVRGVIDGTYKPRDRKTLGWISQVQKHIENKITNGKFGKYDMQVLVALLQNKTKSSNSDRPKNGGKVVRKNKSGQEQPSFADSFLTASWFETLEKLYSRGEGRFASLCKDIAILSLVSASVGRIAALATELGIGSYHALGLYPLFAGIVTNPNFQKTNPGLDRKLPFLRPRQKTEVKPEDVQTLVDMFPSLSISRTEQLLRKHQNNVEEVTMVLLENPSAAEEKPANSSRHVNSSVPTADTIISKKVIGKQRNMTSRVPDEAKNKTLEAALRLLYEGDEDEHDDTYDEVEATTGGDQSKYDKIEKYLWDILKSDEGAFEKTARKSRKRKEMRDETKWSDEQIEGWARMIQKSPKRAKILEEKYMFRGNKPERSAFYKPKHIDADIDGSGSEREKTASPAPQNGGQKKGHKKEDKKDHGDQSQKKAPTKQQAARNEKQKSSRANHNRKAGHDKKMAKGM